MRLCDFATTTPSTTLRKREAARCLKKASIIFGRFLKNISHFERFLRTWDVIFLILEGPGNARYCPRTKNSQTKRSGAVESNLPDRSISEGSRFGGTLPESCVSVCLSQKKCTGKRPPDYAAQIKGRDPETLKILLPRLRRKPALRVHSSKNL